MFEEIYILVSMAAGAEDGAFFVAMWGLVWSVALYSGAWDLQMFVTMLWNTSNMSVVLSSLVRISAHCMLVSSLLIESQSAQLRFKLSSPVFTL